MPIAHLPADAGPDDVAAAVGRDGAVIVDGVAPASLLDRIEAELRPYLDATPTGPDDFSGTTDPAHRLADRPLARLPRARHAPAGARHGRARSSGTPPTSSCT